MNTRWLRVFLVALIIFTPILVIVPTASAQDFPHVEASKNVNPSRTEQDGTLTVTITLRGAGGLVQTPVDVVLIIDRSGSMTGKKIADAKDAAKVFLGYTDERDQVGLVTFSSTVQSVSPLNYMTSTNKESLTKKINSITAVGATNMYDAIIAANNMLLNSTRSDAPHVEVLLTDGNHNWPSMLSDSVFLDLANQAKSEDIIIYTIGLGSDVSGDRLRMIADTTGGTYYFAATSSELRAIYEDIGSKLAFAGTNIKVTETVPSYLTYNDDATKTPSITSSGGATVLEWRLGSLKVGEEWEVTYTAQALRAVEAVSTVVQCHVEYTTSESASALLNLTPGIVFHDISVTGITAVPDSVDKGQIITLQVSAQNVGPSRETFDLRISYDGTILETRSLALNSGESSTITVKWNTSDVDTGEYEVTAEADPNQNVWETNRNDNVARTTVEIVGADAGTIFLLMTIIIIITAAVAGTIYAKPRIGKSAYTRSRARLGYKCTVDGAALKYSHLTQQWHCPVCGTRYKFPLV